MRGIVNWLVRKIWGKSVRQLMVEADGLQRARDHIGALRDRIGKIEKLFRAEKYKKEAKERTIKSKNTMIVNQRRLLAESQKSISHWQDQAHKNADFFDKAIKLGQSKEKEYRRKIKCLHEQVRARNIKINKLENGDKLSIVSAQLMEARHFLSEVRSTNYKLARKLGEAKKFIADNMDKVKKLK